jgi:transcription-repair coupling factor (superfamily II helicase)
VAGHRRHCFIPAWETLSARRTSCRTPTSSATACKRSSRFLENRHSPLAKTQNSDCHQRHRAAAKNLSARRNQERTRTFERGEKIAPLDLIEWLEAQGYEPEAQVSQKGEIALRGGIVDVFPPTSPWPVRLEFFGDELESLREFDPLTQVSRGEISSVTLPPAGELGILKQWQVTSDKWQEEAEAANKQNHVTRHPSLATLLDYLPRETVFLLCANRNRSPSTPMPTNSKFRRTIHFSFRGRISWLN